MVGTAAAGVVEESAQLVSFVDQPALLERLLGRDAGRNITEDEVMRTGPSPYLYTAYVHCF